MRTNRDVVEPRFNNMIQNGSVSPQNYNAILWIIDMLYLPRSPQRDLMREDLFRNVYNYAREARGQGAAIPSATQLSLALDDDEIEVIQQIAMWQFTNADQAGPSSPVLTGSQVITNMLFTGSLHTDDILVVNGVTVPSSTRTAAIELLYEYLVETARANMATAPTAIIPPGLTQRHISLGNTMPEVELRSLSLPGAIGEHYVVGPFNLTSAVDLSRINLDLGHTLTIVRNGVSTPAQIGGGNTQIPITNANGQVITGATLENRINAGAFYLRIPVGPINNLDRVTLDINYNLSFWETTRACYYDAGVGEQPVVIVDRVRRTRTGTDRAEVTVAQDGNFNLNIRKTNESGNLILSDSAQFRIERINANGTLHTDMGLFYTTDNNLTTGVITGVITIANIPIESANETFYFRITETRAPHRYERIVDPFYIRVRTEVDGMTRRVRDVTAGIWVAGFFVPGAAGARSNFRE